MRLITQSQKLAVRYSNQGFSREEIAVSKYMESTRIGIGKIFLAGALVFSGAVGRAVYELSRDYNSGIERTIDDSENERPTQERKI